MEYKHPWIPMTKATEKEMLESIGKKNLDELFSNIPEKFMLKQDLSIPRSHSEIEVTRRIQELAGKNRPADDGRTFLGAGIGMHYVPAIVPALATRSEFLTSYTSYQAEVSQGMLQTLFEYQSLLAEILDIDIVNSSMYDMATAVAEAARMTVRVKKKRSKFLVPGTINPEHYKVLYTYTEPVDIEVVRVAYDEKTGLMSLSDLESKLDDQVAGVYIENPSYLGFIESQVDEINKLVHDNGSLLVATFGGPLLGVFGCIKDRKLIYQMPGRLVGMTRTESEPYENGFVLTLSPREQHIRREKATSNICSNQALAAVVAAIYMSLLGPAGLQQLGETIGYNANYTARRLDHISGVRSPAIGDAIWKEFVVQFEDRVTAEQVHDGLLERDLHGGRILTNEFPSLGESMLFCVTEVHSKETIDELIQAIEEIVAKGGAKR
ncbi:MAG: aminomethyl-transferring glycine dehydrogenase subunit GcvPA [Candidatus Thorarchaeota archaeon]|jgi:glycine dehydrogenase subunit 1